MEPTDPLSSPAAIAKVLDQMWARHLPSVRDRIAVLEAATAAAAADQLTTEQRQAAHAAAHKLSGVLGTFGLMRGTDLARRMEVEFSGDTGPDRVRGKDLQKQAAEIRAMIENRKPAA
jgi:HPt (histidine-containing phosphotransfer) domain-containing protein